MHLWARLRFGLFSGPWGLGPAGDPLDDEWLGACIRLLNVIAVLNSTSQEQFLRCSVSHPVWASGRDLVDFEELRAHPPP
jgi:hypothetical protein